MDEGGGFVKYIVAVGIVLALFVIALVGFSMVDSFDYADIRNEVDTFTVDDPDVNKVCALDHVPRDSQVTVRYYNGTSWKTLSSSDYTLVGSVVTVSASAMD